MRIIFLGSGDIGMPALRLLGNRAGVELAGIVSQPDRPVGRGLQVRTGPVAAFAKEQGIPLFQPERLRGSDTFGQLALMRPDLFVVMAYGQILPREVLAIPSIAPLNLHASLLPRHRGASPIQSAILSGDSTTGISVMYMAEGLDTGDVFLQKSTPIFPEDTGGSLHDRLADLAAEALEEALKKIGEGQMERHPQNGELATYAKKLTRDNGKIDWEQPAEEIARRVRAFDPWPGAQTRFAGDAGTEKVLKIWKADAVAGKCALRPGEIAKTDKSWLEIAAGDGVLRVLEVQAEGRKRLATGEFLRGFPMGAGTKFF